MDRDFFSFPRNRKQTNLFAFGHEKKQIDSFYSFSYFKPTDMPNIAFWYKPDDGVIIDELNRVSQWSDSSGNGRHIVQATAANMPIFITSGFTWESNVTLPVPNTLKQYGFLRFDGVNDSLKATSFTFSQPYSIYIVFRKRNTTSTVYYVFDGNTTNAMALRTGTEPTIILLSASAGPSINMTSNMFNIVSCIWNTTSSYIQNNTEAIAGPGSPGSNNGTGFCLGAVGAQTSNYAPVDVLEVVGYTGAHSEVERSYIRNYLNNKYSIYHYTNERF